MAEKFSDIERELIRDTQKVMSEKHYCAVCGQEIIRYSGESEKYEAEVLADGHLECIQRYQQEQRARLLKERREKEAKEKNSK
jgi:hypothetical protein